MELARGAWRMITTRASERGCSESAADGLPGFGGRIQSDNLPSQLGPELLPALETLVLRVRPKGLWLFGSWARGTASRRSDIDLLVMGLEHCRLLEAYNAVLVATPQLLARHADAPFWRTLRAEAIPLLMGSRFP